MLIYCFFFIGKIHSVPDDVSIVHIEGAQYIFSFYVGADHVGYICSFFSRLLKAWTTGLVQILVHFFKVNSRPGLPALSMNYILRTFNLVQLKVMIVGKTAHLQDLQNQALSFQLMFSFFSC